MRKKTINLAKEVKNMLEKQMAEYTKVWDLNKLELNIVQLDFLEGRKNESIEEKSISETEGLKW